MWFKSQSEWNFNWWILFICKIRKSYKLNVFCCCRKFPCTSFLNYTFRSCNMVEKFFGEKIPITRLSSSTIHGNKISWVDSISKKFDCHSWNQRIGGRRCSSWGQSYKSIIRSFEKSCVLMFTITNKFSFCNNSYRMNEFSSWTP